MNSTGRNVHRSQINENNIIANGVTAFQKNVTAQTIKNMGDIKFKANLVAEEFINKGNSNIKKCKVNSLKSTGSLKADSIESDHIKAFGYIRCDKTIQTKTFQLVGSLRIGSILANSSISIKRGPLMEIGSSSKVGRIVSKGKVMIQGSKLPIPVFIWGRLSTNYIEGQLVDIEDVEAEQVIGEEIYIRANCKVDRIVYKNHLYVHPTSTVKFKEKLTSEV